MFHLHKDENLPYKFEQDLAWKMKLLFRFRIQLTRSIYLSPINLQGLNAKVSISGSTGSGAGRALRRPPRSSLGFQEGPGRPQSCGHVHGGGSQWVTPLGFPGGRIFSHYSREVKARDG